jgi:hypothetical protein
MLIDVAGSLLGVSGRQQTVRAIEVELRLPIEVKVRGTHDALVFCADVPAWRWRTDWDPPFGELRFTLEEAPLEIAQ